MPFSELLDEALYQSCTVALSFKVRVDADIEDVCRIRCQHCDQVADRLAVQAQTITKIIAVFNACGELEPGPGVIRISLFDREY